NEGLLHVPTASFNTVYIPIHIFRHLFSEGIGMRQILDYYFVLMQENTAQEKEDCVEILKKTGVLRFTKALMYVMQEMFALDKEHMIAEPDSRHGKFLMREIMLSGNFGKMDARFGQRSRGYNLQHFKNQLKRSFMLIGYHPSETFWNPLFKIWHTFWMKRHRPDAVNA
ncbi:MAG: nucleotidyltransferase family protein, partial [Bacteroidaceae bacterium]|nr:nucleotidyltransferase family protein [Bacteroidaceae bacterium]